MKCLRFTLCCALVMAGMTFGADPAVLVGQWDFDDAQNLTLATLGNDLTLSGQDYAVTGCEVSDGAARIGVGSHYICDHGIAPASGETYVNEFSLVMDVSFPDSSTGLWKALYQTNNSNANDGDCFISPVGAVGVSSTGYTDDASPVFLAQADAWHRIVIVVDSEKQYDIFVDGSRYLQGTPQPTDGRFTLDPQVLFFADENSEDNAMDVSTILLYKGVLTDSEVAALNGPLGQDPSQTGSMLTDPYLQNLKSDRITIMWELQQQETCTVDYGPDESYGNTANPSSTTSSAGTEIYSCELTGLTAGATYHFRVNIAQQTGADRTFTTSPAGEADFSFAVWSDSQGASNATIPMMQHMAGSGVDFGVACGDMCENGGDYGSVNAYFLDRVAEHLGQVVPFDIAWGNHDGYGNAMIKEFSDFGAGNYSFTRANCYFICIDNEYRSDYNWIESELQTAVNNNARHIFVFVHRPPYCERWYDGEADFRTNLVPLFEQYGVDACFSGHTHEYERGFLNDVYYCITGGGSWLDHSEPLVYDWSHMTVGGYHDLGSGITGGLVNEYVRVDVDSNGWTATMIAFDPDGNPLTGVTDSFSAVSGGCTPSSTYVHSIVPGTSKGSKGQEYGQVNVTVFDDCGNLVAGADVTGTFSGDFSEQHAATTNASGIAVITTAAQVKKPAYMFCVDSISHPTLSYDASSNTETCDNY
ncbi:Calcineurin-like phosphoesterase [Anaerohalosphaera lusitana]|uniref:Calcineurin-like phosphoesterase n=1 Tax=Anaerohalosphaera lusitana TaxID=1936003 RepID=A0A1U9NIX9_9BACT|nr:metallophosphoesterase [Anaerohalosphaera lusitana]AQT67889.1 Calcineurin-like phosphoesterase [Anaerohalosphaera lusitana]